MGAKAGHEQAGAEQAACGRRRKGGEALAVPPAGQAGCRRGKRKRRTGPVPKLGWKGRKESFSKSNPFLFLFFKSKPNSNEI